MMDGLSNRATTMTLKFGIFYLILMGLAVRSCLGNVPYTPNRYDTNANRYNDDYYLQPSIRSYVAPNNNYPARSPGYNYDRSDSYDRDSYRGRSGSSNRYPSRQKDYDSYDRSYDRGSGRDYSYRSSNKNSDYDRDYYNYASSYIKPSHPVCTTKTSTSTVTETATPSCSTVSTSVYQQYISEMCFKTATATSKGVGVGMIEVTSLGTYGACSPTPFPLPTVKKAYVGSSSTGVPCIGTITSTKTKYSGIACTFMVQETKFKHIDSVSMTYSDAACPFTSASTLTACLDSRGNAVTALKQMSPRRMEEDED